MDGDRESLASELLHEVKSTSKRWFILFIICLIMLFATNLAWLYAWNLPAEETATETTITQDSDNASSNNFIGAGGVINGSETDDTH